jgi:hypothetical protein
VQKREWFSEDADLQLRSDDGGRALFWYREEPALLMIEDPARAGIQIELTTLADAHACASDLLAEEWWEDPVGSPRTLPASDDERSEDHAR